MEQGYGRIELGVDREQRPPPPVGWGIHRRLQHRRIL